MLGDLGLEVHALQPAALQAEGVWLARGTLPSGAPIRVKVYGRDAWSAQLVAAVSHFLTHRGPGSHLALTRVQQAEHEALMSLVAHRAGVGAPVTDLVAKAPNGDVVAVATHTDVRPLVAGDAAAPRLAESHPRNAAGVTTLTVKFMYA